MCKAKLWTSNRSWCFAVIFCPKGWSFGCCSRRAAVSKTLQGGPWAISWQQKRSSWRAEQFWNSTEAGVQMWKYYKPSWGHVAGLARLVLNDNGLWNILGSLVWNLHVHVVADMQRCWFGRLGFCSLCQDYDHHCRRWPQLSTAPPQRIVSVAKKKKQQVTSSPNSHLQRCKWPPSAFGSN